MRTISRKITRMNNWYSYIRWVYVFCACPCVCVSVLLCPCSHFGSDVWTCHVIASDRISVDLMLCRVLDCTNTTKPFGGREWNESSCTFLLLLLLLIPTTTSSEALAIDCIEPHGKITHTLTLWTHSVKPTKITKHILPCIPLQVRLNALPAYRLLNPHLPPNPPHQKPTHSIRNSSSSQPNQNLPTTNTNMNAPRDDCFDVAVCVINVQRLTEDLKTFVANFYSCRFS